MSGHVGHIKVVNDLTIAGNLAGLTGYLELPGGTKTITGTTANVLAGVWGRVDAVSGRTIGADTIVSAFGASGDLGGAHTGKAVVLNVRAPSAGAWDGLLNIPAALANAANGVGADKYIEIFIDGTAARITAKLVA